jgi:3D (Asp-Asp-Asp) domain-containing protein
MLKTLLLLSVLSWQPAEVTAYCSCERCCGEFADGVTASGHELKAGDLVVAAPRSIPFGTKIFIPGYGLATVEDIGGAITGNRLDVWFPTHEEALQWGRQNLEVIYVNQ